MRKYLNFNFNLNQRDKSGIVESESFYIFSFENRQISIWLREVSTIYPVKC